MKQKDSFTRETLEKIRSTSGADNSKKGRKTGRIILVLDAVIIVLILLFFFGSEEETLYKSTAVSLDSIEYRLSVTAAGERDDIMFSLSIKNTGSKPYYFPFKKKIGKLTLRISDREIFKDSFTLHSSPLNLAPGSSHAASISCFKTELLPPKKDKKEKSRGFLSLFGKSGASKPVNALAEIYLHNILALKLKFKL